MEESNLDALRAKRMAQLQAEGRNQNPAEERAAAEEQQRQTNDMKNAMLSQILTQAARARLNTLMIGKPEKGRMVENMLLNMAQSGQIVTKLQEEELIGILERVNQQLGPCKNTTVKFDRRRAALDSDDEL